MKVRILPFALLCSLMCYAFSIQAQNASCRCTSQYADNICDDFDAYSTSTRLGPQSACWTTWSGNEGGSEDGIIQQGSNGNKYLSIRGSSSSSGGPQDVVLQLGNRTGGGYELRFTIWVSTYYRAYFNILHSFSPSGSNQWGQEVYFEGNGSGRLRVGGGNYYFSYQGGQWIDVVQYFDIDNNIAHLYIGGQYVRQWPFNYQSGSTGGGVSRLAALNFYAINSSYQFYVDEVRLTSYGSNCLNIYRANPGAFCTQEYNPVCGCNGVEYGNACLAAIAGVDSWASGRCEAACIDPDLINPNPICTQEVQWVCGCNDQTYVNPCYARADGVTEWTYGQCNNTPCVDPNVIPDEGVYCPQNYDPVCGCNGQTYSNECYALLDGVTQWTDGPCGGVECGYDPYEPNEQSAKRIYPFNYYYGLICPIGDYDWFYFYSSNSQPHVRVQLTSLPDDYDLYLYDSYGNLVDYSLNSGSSNELVTYNYTRGQLYYVLVDGYESAWHPSDTYRLRAELSSTPFYGGESQNGNSSPEEVNMRDGQSEKNIRLNEIAPPEMSGLAGPLSLSNAPNPFRGQTEIQFNLPEEGEISLHISDIQGRTVAQLLEAEHRAAGSHTHRFDAGALAPGIYFCTLTTKQEREMIKMLVQ